MAEFKEVGRIQVSPSVAVVISQTMKEGEVTGLSLNKFISTDDYKGFAKGIFIPKTKYEDFLKLIKDAGTSIEK